jgi:hypothetical protein
MTVFRFKHKFSKHSRVLHSETNILSYPPTLCTTIFPLLNTKLSKERTVNLLESQNVLPLDNESKALIMKLLKFHF